jgi:nucleotidyltransferase substrate binding protein (TIGR01987 family)
MERLKEQLALADKALQSLEVLAFRSVGEISDIERDAAIQRFEYTQEAVWRAAQRYLLVVEGLEANSPKGVIRAAATTLMLEEEEARLAFQMIDDRNLTVHTYNEELANAIFSRLGAYAQLLRAWLARLRVSDDES